MRHDFGDAGSGGPPAAGGPIGEPLLRCRQVGKRYRGGTSALEAVDLDVAVGEFISVLGPSGCGKSTLLKLISGLAEPTAGAITWPGSATGKRSAAAGRTAAADDRSALSFVFQEPTLLPWSTALRNVALPLKLAHVAKAERLARAAEALAAVGLGGFEAAYPRELSGGMKMRVSIARALITRPRLLLMDEPFAALDEITRARLNADLLQLWRRDGFTVIFVTHSVFESVFLSQRIAVMAARPGRIASLLKVDEPYPRPAAYRTSPGYAANCVKVSAALERAMGAPEGAACTPD